MKRASKLAGSIVVVAVFSVGFRYETSELLKPVNMYWYQDKLYVSDEAYGIRIYDVSNPSSPKHLMGIPLQGNAGLAVKDNIVYANSYESLLALRIKDWSSYDTATVIRKAHIYWEDNDVYYDRHPGFFSCGETMDASYSNGGTEMANKGGTGGSYAIFAVVDTFLYYLDGSDLQTASIAKPDKPVTLSTTYISWNVETLFPTRKYLFIGGQTGMYVMDRGNPAFPTVMGSVQHLKSCDPVVVDDTMAYVTLRSGNTCGDNRDELLAVSVTDPTRPYIVNELPATTPYGLSIRDSLLYVSNGYRGLTLYSVSDPRNIRTVASLSTPQTKDFIWLGNTLYVMGFDEMLVLDVTDPTKPTQVARIE